MFDHVIYRGNCNHHKVEYCPHCDITYCPNCGQKWIRPHQYYPYKWEYKDWRTSPTISFDEISYTTNHASTAHYPMFDSTCKACLQGDCLKYGTSHT